MREEHRRGMRDEGWGPLPGQAVPSGGRGPGEARAGTAESAADFRGERGGPGWGPGGPGRHGGPAGAAGAGASPWTCRPSGPAARGPVPVIRRSGLGRRGFGRGMRARKGDVRAAILDLFAEEEGRAWNGYQLIQEIPARTDGAWRPSAGSVYPALQQLEDEGLIAPQGTGRRRVFTLTDKGRDYVEAHADDLRSSWDAAAGMTDDDAIEFRNLIRQVMMAVMEVRRAGSAEQVAQARAVLAQARKSLYLILAEDEPATDGRRDAGCGPTDTGEDAPEGAE